ncbi:MAG: PAS domain-containing protein [Brevundimonas sp.]
MIEQYILPQELISVLNASPDLQLLLSGDQTILFANAAFHATNPDEAGPLTGQSLAASLLGRDARRAASRRIILDTVRSALATGGIVRPPIFRYDIQKRLDDPPREAWWSLSASPFDLNGRPCVLLTSREVTAAVRDARGEGDTAGVPDSGSLVWAERRRLAQMFEQTTDMMALVVGRDHVFELVNPAGTAACGDTQLLGRSVRDLVRSPQGLEVLRLLDNVRETGRPFTARALPLQMTRDAAHDHFIDLTLQPLTSDDGQVEAIFCRGQDVTESVRALATQSFLRDELAHREGNILAVVLALAEQSASHAPSLDQFRASFAGRLSALAAVNAALNAQGPAVSVAALLQAVAHRGGAAPRLSGTGGGATLRPKAAITLGLMFHELLRMSQTDGAPDSTQPRIRAHQHAGRLYLIWMSTLSRDYDEGDDGFGRRLVDHAVRRDFGGDWRIVRRRNAVVFRFEFPLGHSAWAHAGAAV